MAEFPKLKTGAAAQYPLTRTLVTQTRALPFLDGTQQQFSAQKARRRWTIRLDLLDEGELARIDEFVAAYLTTLENFAFTDPYDGQRYEACAIEGQRSDIQAQAPSAGALVLTIVEEMS